jgi:tRNA(Arg) A34 adenosine deaminase TadA
VTTRSYGPCEPIAPDIGSNLERYWDARVGDLCQPHELREMSEPSEERHRIFALACMALVTRFWNGNKRGQFGEYPWREGQKLAEHGIYDGGRYLGHNIACLAVDGDGRIIDFDFNHNEVFSSSVEHAESRLIRRVFSLTQIWEDRALRSANDPPSSYSTILSKVTVFTSLESCSQCAGIMALGRVKHVVYLQRDPGMYLIGNILRNLATSDLPAPLPIPGCHFGLTYYDRLNAAYERFRGVVRERPFWRGQGRTDSSPSITSFLCTDEARTIFSQATAEFLRLELSYPAYKPDSGNEPAAVREMNLQRMLSNAEALDAARQFVAYVSASGNRGTPHQL